MNTALLLQSLDKDLSCFSENNKGLKSAMKVLYVLEHHLGEIFIDNDLIEKLGAYSHISSSYGELCLQLEKSKEILDLIHKKRPVEYIPPSEYKFLDIGCGFGTKVLFADALGFDAWGIECNKKYADIAKRITFYWKIKKGNALNYKKYNEYDILYFYEPMKSNKIDKFYKKVLNNAKSPSIIVHSTLWGNKYNIFNSTKDISDQFLYDDKGIFFKGDEEQRDMLKNKFKFREIKDFYIEC